jgi:hypothetical protein
VYFDLYAPAGVIKKDERRRRQLLRPRGGGRMRVLGQHCAEGVSFAFCETLLFSWDFVSDGSRMQANTYRDAENNELRKDRTCRPGSVDRTRESSFELGCLCRITIFQTFCRSNSESFCYVKLAVLNLRVTYNNATAKPTTLASCNSLEGSHPGSSTCVNPALAKLSPTGVSFAGKNHPCV